MLFIKPKIISWNVRGMNDSKKRLRIRGLLREWKADIVCLQETKMEVISREVVRSVWGCIHVDWLYLGSRRASGGVLLMWDRGGVLLMWDRRVVEKIEDYVGRFVVACSFNCVQKKLKKLNGPLRGFMGQKMMWKEDVYGMNWLI